MQQALFPDIWSELAEMLTQQPGIGPLQADMESKHADISALQPAFGTFHADLVPLPHGYDQLQRGSASLQRCNGALQPVLYV